MLKNYPKKTLTVIVLVGATAFSAGYFFRTFGKHEPTPIQTISTPARYSINLKAQADKINITLEPALSFKWQDKIITPTKPGNYEIALNDFLNGRGDFYNDAIELSWVGELGTNLDMAAMENNNQSAAVSTSTAKPYVASKNGTSYHPVENCSFASRIKEENRVYFSSREEAEAAGYKPSSCFK